MNQSITKELHKNTEKIRKIIAKQGYCAIDSFCGPGGMSLGLSNAGFNVCYAFDKDQKAIETHLKNLDGLAEVALAQDLTGEILKDKCNIGTKEIDLFAGGPPCQGFSKQKRGAHLGDSRNSLIEEYIRLITEVAPRFFLFENVAIFGQKRGAKYIALMEDSFKDYELFPAFYNAADYGLAQTRQRFIIVGKRKDINARFSPPSPTVSKWKTVGEAIGDLPEPPKDYTHHPDFPNHQRARVTDINIKRFSFVPEGGGWQDIPDEYRLACHKNANPKKGGWPDVYGRLVWDGQCPTITGGFDSFTRGRYGHPKQNRPITPREAARIQGFPDSYVFCGTRADMRTQIGNAVPPQLAEALAFEIGKTLASADGVIEG